MSAIFKDRKIPRHLIIQDEYQLRLKPRVRTGKYLLWGASALALVLIMVSVPGVWTETQSFL